MTAVMSTPRSTFAPWDDVPHMLEFAGARSAHQIGQRLKTMKHFSTIAVTSANLTSMPCLLLIEIVGTSRSDLQMWA